MGPRIVASLTERELLDKLLAKLQGEYLAHSTVEREAPLSGMLRPDAVLRTEKGEEIVVECHRRGDYEDVVHGIGQLALYKQSMPGAYGALLLPRISEQGKELCRHYGVGYVTMNEAHLRFGQVLVDRQMVGAHRGIGPGRGKEAVPFSRVASRVVRALLEEPERPWGRLRTIQETIDQELAKQSLDHERGRTSFRIVREAVSELAREVRVVDQQRRRSIRLLDAKKLAELWSTRYVFLSSKKFQTYYEPSGERARLLERIKTSPAEFRRRIGFTVHSAPMLESARERIQTLYLYVKPIDGPDWEPNLRRTAEQLRLSADRSELAVRLIDPYDIGVFYHATAEGIPAVCRTQQELDAASLAKHPPKPDR